MSNLDNLKQSWQADQKVPAELFDRIGLAAKNSTDLLQSKIARRDSTEAFSSVLVGAIFLGMSFYTKTWIDWTGCMVVLATSFWIPWRMWQARKGPKLKLSAATFGECLENEIDLIDRQIDLLRNVGWWYLLPLFAGISLMLIGLLGPPFAPFNIVVLITAIGICFSIYTWVWSLNQEAWKNHLVPLRDYYVQVRDALDQNDDSLLPSVDAPTEFLIPKRRQPIGVQRWRIGWITTVVGTIAIAIVGIYLFRNFDERTGAFVFSSVPVVAILLIAITGIWKRIYGIDDSISRK